jgi:hypothetical protein
VDGGRRVGGFEIDGSMATSIESVLADAMDWNWFWEFFVGLKVGCFARHVFGAG